jgi:hypothetical protein
MQTAQRKRCAIFLFQHFKIRNLQRHLVIYGKFDAVDPNF